jgi:diacylglycerol kinase
MNTFFKSFGYAWQGMRSAFREQRNLKVQFAIASMVIVIGFVLSINVSQWAILLICIALVISLEMINTAIEKLVDLVTTEWKPKAGKIKDVSAGAVLLASIISVAVGVITLWEPAMEFISLFVHVDAPY